MNANKHETLELEVEPGRYATCEIVREIKLDAKTVELLVKMPDGELYYAFEHLR